MEQIDLVVDVTEAVGLDEKAAIALTVHLPAPDSLGAVPFVCFAKPGGGFSRGYFTTDLPGPASGSQARWHAARGWVFVSVDHLGVGDSSTHHDPMRLGFATVTAAACAAERVVLERLAQGSLHPSFPPVRDPVVLGLGQSMGGGLTVAQQGRYHSYDGVGVLGFSAVRTHLPSRPGEPAAVRPWYAHDTLSGEGPIMVNRARVQAAQRGDWETDAPADRDDWVFYYDDVDIASVRRQYAKRDEVEPWLSTTYPAAVALSSVTPGIVAAEAAAIDVPVLVAAGERDVVPDPAAEPRAYLSAASVDLFVCPRMAHMHNFAGSRELFWRRIETWAEWVGVVAAEKRVRGTAVR